MIASAMTNRDLVYIAAFAALTAALGLIPPVPLPIIPVPITLQSLGVMLSGSLLGAKRGGLALLLFLLLVAIGLPVLAGGRGGFGIFLGPSGGFLCAFPLAAFVIGWLTERSPKRFSQRLTLGWMIGINLLGGIGVIYALGIPWLAIAAQRSLLEATLGATIFLPGDIFKVVIASMTAVTLHKTYPLLKTR